MGYSLHCLRVCNSSIVLFKIALSVMESTAETGKQTKTFPRYGCLKPSFFDASSLKATNRLIICQLLMSNSALCTSPNKKPSEVKACFQNNRVISTIKKPLLVNIKRFFITVLLKADIRSLLIANKIVTLVTYCRLLKNKPNSNNLPLKNDRLSLTKPQKCPSQANIMRFGKKAPMFANVAAQNFTFLITSLKQTAAGQALTTKFVGQ